MARWNPREGHIEAGIAVFQDRSARPPLDALQRNLALFNAAGQLGVLGRQFRFGFAFNHPTGDIELTFIDRSTMKSVFRRLPIGSLTSTETDKCRVYVQVAESDAPVRVISKSLIFVDDEVNNSDLPTCVADALVRAIGLIRWPSDLDDRRSPFDRYTEARLFLSVLYGISESPEPPLVRKQLIDARSATCP
jgi:hypothetical protein